MKAQRTDTIRAAAPATAPAPTQWEQLYRDLATFADRPELPEGADPAEWTCQVMTVRSGFIQIGKAHVEVDKPIRFTFGASFGQLLIGSIGIGDTGNELLRVRGGLIGIAAFDRWIKKIPLAQIYVQPLKTDMIEPGPGFRSYVSGITVKMRIPLMRRECVIGSVEDPVKLALTAYTTDPPPPNQPISGTEVMCTDQGFDGGTVVDNAFGVPAIRGPGRRSISRRIFDRIANARAGLPAPAGHNTLVFTDVSLRVINYDVLEEATRQVAAAKQAESSG